MGQLATFGPALQISHELRPRLTSCTSSVNASSRASPSDLKRPSDPLLSLSLLLRPALSPPWFLRSCLVGVASPSPHAVEFESTCPGAAVRTRPRGGGNPRSALCRRPRTWGSTLRGRQISFNLISIEADYFTVAIPMLLSCLLQPRHFSASGRRSGPRE